MESLSSCCPELDIHARLSDHQRHTADVVYGSAFSTISFLVSLLVRPLVDSCRLNMDLSYIISEILDVGVRNDLQISTLLQISFKVIESDTNRKLVYDFLLVVYSNFCCIIIRCIIIMSVRYCRLFFVIFTSFYFFFVFQFVFVFYIRVLPEWRINILFISRGPPLTSAQGLSTP